MASLPTKTVNINVRIQEDLHNQIKILLLDPRTGRMPDRAWAKVIEEGIQLLIEQRKASHDNQPS